MQAARYWTLQWLADREALSERRVLSVPVAGVHAGRGFLADLHLELLDEEGPLVEHPDMALRPLGRELLNALEDAWQTTRQCVCWTPHGTGQGCSCLAATGRRLPKRGGDCGIPTAA